MSLSRLQQLQGGNQPSAPAQQPTQPTQTVPPNPNPGVPRHLYRGAAIQQKAEANAAEAEKRAELRKQGFALAFFISMDEAKKGAVKPIIVLDASIQAAVAFNEHTLKDDKGNFGATEICVNDYAKCPICAKGEYPSFVVKLTILDMTPYTHLKGEKAGKTDEFTKKIITIKPKALAKWSELEQACIKANGTFRGCYLEMKRDHTDTNSLGIGEPTMFDKELDIVGRGKVMLPVPFDFISEEDLVAFAGSPEVRGSNGQVTKLANADITPFDYALLYPEPDLDDLNRRYGGAPVTGSASQVAKEWEQKAPAATPATTAATALAAARSRIRTQTPVETKPAMTEEEAFNAAQPVAGAEVQADGVVDDDDIPFGG